MDKQKFLSMSYLERNNQYEKWSKNNSYPRWIIDYYEELITKYPHLSLDAIGYMLILTTVDTMTEEEALKWPAMSFFLMEKL
ncbi:hypothetical protein EJP82_25165 [Paenibacillus anaericanus]|uniref:Uncharacterized protein n=1 Tax=Paenibacillus anaericanus TaxID=170367 RepID=A0A433XYY5_9BACL|nr:hypothetical protein [Paenibacillus anaericanus]RUT40314.1 hypothetical protein EJP82_25165 [Paenibacillus anaericanus]